MPDSVSSPFGDADDMEILNSEDTSDEQTSEDTEGTRDSSEDIGDDTSEEEIDDEEPDSGDDDESDEEPDADDDKIVGAPFPGKPTWKELKKYDPNLFKKFPGLRDAFFREGEYAEVYPTVDDAREAAEQLNQYRSIEQTILSGDPQDFLTLLGDADKAASEKFIYSFLPTLAKSNSEVFQNVTRPFLKHVLRTIHKGAKTKDLENSVLHIHNELFGDFDLDKQIAPKVQRTEQAPRDEKYERERAEFYGRKEKDFGNEIASGTKSEIEATIGKLVDPKNALSDYDRRNIYRDILEELDKQLTADSQHMNIMGSLWTKARKSGYQPEFKERIRTAYLSRAKMLLPGISRKVRSEALAARGKTVRAVRKEDRTSNVNGSASPSQRSSRLKEDEIDFKNSSDLDILNDTPKLKRR